MQVIPIKYVVLPPSPSQMLPPPPMHVGALFHYCHMDLGVVATNDLITLKDTYSHIINFMHFIINNILLSMSSASC